MKKFLYHYLNLLIAAIQCFISTGIIVGLIRYEWEIFDLITMLLVLGIPNFFLSLLDAWIRDFSYFWMTILSFFLSPIRFYAQLFTTIRLHTLTAQGIRDYAERNDYHHNFKDIALYVIFSTSTPFVRYTNGKKHIVLSKKAQAEKDRRDKVMKEYQERVQHRSYTIKNNKDSLTSPNVVLVPIVLFNNAVKYFGYYDGLQSTYYYNNGPKQIEQVAKITKLEINGINYLSYPINELFSPTGLYLKPGKYNIKIGYKLKIAPPNYGVNFSPKEVNINTSINNFYVDSYNEKLYIGLVCKLEFGWTRVSNNYTRKVEDRDSTWDFTYSLRKYSFSELNSYLYNTDRDWFNPTIVIDE